MNSAAARESVKPSFHGGGRECAQLLVPNELVRKAGEARIEPARIRHDEHPRAGDRLGLFARAAARFQLEERLIKTEAHERDDARLHARDLARERVATELDFRGREVRRRTGGTRANVGERNAEFREFLILHRREGLGYEPRREKQTPKRIARTREVMTDPPRRRARVDAYQEDPRTTGGGHVAKRLSSRFREPMQSFF